MKGVVFSEFLDMVEASFSPEMVEDIIAAAELPHGGAYTAVGTYPYTEMVRLVGALSQRSGKPVPELLTIYGHRLFDRLRQSYPSFFEGVVDSFAFLAAVQDVVHVEVRKLYPDAELPQFRIEKISDSHMVMTYRSPRCLGDLAQGLIGGCFTHFDEDARIVRHDSEDGREVRFDLLRREARHAA